MRHLQKFRLESANQHIGPLHQRGHFVQQRLVVNRAHPAADLRRCGLQLAHDVGTAFGKAGNYRAFITQLHRIAIGIAQHHRIDLGLEAMALRGVARRQSQHGNRHHLAAMQRHQSMRRTHEIHRLPAIGQLVAHHLRNRQLGQRLFQRLLQARRQCDAFLGALIHQHLVLAVLYALQLRHHFRAHAQPGQPFQQRRGRIARRIQPYAHRHQLLRHALVRRLRRDRRHLHRQTTRRRKRRHRRPRRHQPLRLQGARQRRRKCLPQLLQRLGRQLFYKQFNQ